MKIAIKNFLTTLRRYKVASVLNIAGMTLAFLAFYVIMSQVYYDITYNRSIKDSDRTYILLTRFAEDWIALASRGVAERTFGLWPDVECSGTIRNKGLGAEYVWVKRTEYNYDRYDYRTATMSLPLLDVLSFRTVEGDLRRLSEPETVIISESLAERMGVHAGDDVYLPDMDAKEDDPDAGRKPARRMTVAGVYADFAPNTMMGDVHIAMDAGDDHLTGDKQHWVNYTYYVKLRKGASPEALAEVWKRTEPNVGDDGVRLVPIRDIYYWQTLKFGTVEQGSKSGTAVLFGIAMLIVVVAFINFVNFFFAMIPVRLRAVNICKVFGAPTSALRWNFLFESVGMVLCSLLLALYLMVVVQESFLAEYVTCSLAMSDNLPALALVLVITVIIALASSLYPAWYITSFNASLAVKSGFAGSGAGRRLRLVLVGVQFTVSIALIVVAACFWLQYRYMINYDIGIDRENLMSFNLPYKDAAMYPVLTERMNGMPEIVGVTASVDAVVGNGSAEVIRMKYEGRDLELHFRYVRSNFLDVMGIRLAEGENFTPDMDNAATRYAIFCRSTCDEYGFYPGFVVMAGTEPICRVIGIVDDVLGQPLDSKQSNTVYCTTSEDQWMGDVYFRTAANVDIPRLCDRIRAVAKEINPDSEDLNIEFVDEQLQRLYEKTQRSATIIGLFALLAVVISLMGVFGIVLFETQHRRREIALRRVMGSTVEGIVWMFGRHYVTIVAVCFVVAVPVAWYVVSEWLNTFAYRISTPWWIFLAAFLLVTALTMVIVVARCRRTAGENPARVLGGE